MSKYDFMFEGSATERWIEIIRTSNPTLVGIELERLLTKLAILEFEGKNLDAKHLRDIEYNNKEAIEEMKQSIVIESMAKIFSNHE